MTYPYFVKFYLAAPSWDICESWEVSNQCYICYYVLKSKQLHFRVYSV